MPFNIGTTAAKKVFLGTTEIKKIFSGTTQVWTSDPYDEFIYSTSYYSSKVMLEKVSRATFTTVASGETNQSTYYGTPFILAYDDDYIYASAYGWMNYTYVLKFSRSTCALVAEIFIRASNYSIEVDGTYLYATIKGYVQRYNKSTGNYIDQFYLGNTSGPGLGMDSNYIYFGGDDGNHVKSFTKSTMADANYNASYGGGGSYGKGKYVVDDTHIYMIRGWAVHKLTTSLTYAGEYSVNEAHSIAQDDDYIYLGVYNGSNAIVRKIAKSNMSFVKDSSSIISGNYLTALSVDNDYVYAGGYSQTHYKLNKSDLSQVATRQINSNYWQVYGSVIPKNT